MKAHHLYLTLCLALPAIGAGPHPGPDGDGPPPATRPEGGHEGHDGHGEGMGHFMPNEQDVKDASEFLQTTCPNRWKAMQRRNMNVGGSIVMRYMELRRLKTEDPTFYELRVDEMRIEDEIFPLVQKLRNNPEVMDEIKKPAADLLVVRIKESEHRIQKLQEAIAAEQKNLESLHNDDAVSRLANDEVARNNIFGSLGGNPPHRRDPHDPHDHNPKPEVQMTAPATQPAP